MRGWAFCVGLSVAVVLAAGARAETHWQVQAVNDAGEATYYKVNATVAPENLIVLQGMVLNNPEDMLDSTYNTPGFMGAQWQIFIQGEGSDHAGTALWMGQKYSMMGDVDYTTQEWAGEMQRVNFPGGHQIRQGDRIRVTGYGMYRNGKTNINERHTTSPLLDFTVEWLGSAPGLPVPEVIELADVRTAGDVDMFDPTRLTGCEYFQGRLVRINSVHVAEGTWGPGQNLTIGDDTGRTFPVVLGLNPAFSQPSNLGSTFDVVGIFNQENAATSGYQLWVMGYNGSANLLGITPPVTGDVNGDGSVDASDLLLLADSFGLCLGDAGYDARADLKDDDCVDVSDLLVLAGAWAQ
jgi:hypothetical protein